MTSLQTLIAAGAAALACAAARAASPLPTTLPAIPVTVTNTPSVNIANTQPTYPRAPAAIMLTTNNALDPTASTYVVPSDQYLVIETVAAGLDCSHQPGASGGSGSASLLFITGTASGGNLTFRAVPLPLSNGAVTVPMRIALGPGTQVFLRGSLDVCTATVGLANLFGYQMSVNSPSLAP